MDLAALIISILALSVGLTAIFQKRDVIEDTPKKGLTTEQMEAIKKRHRFVNRMDKALQREAVRTK